MPAGEAGSMDMVAMLGDVVPELVIVVGGVVTLLWAVMAPRRWQVGASVLALITIALAFGAAASLLPGLEGAERLTFADTYARDGVAVWSKLIILPATAVVIGLSVPWFRSDPRHGEYYTLLVFSALGAILLAGATDLKEFVVAMILSSATGYVLVGYHRLSSPGSEAAIKYYLIGAFVSAGMLIGVAFLYGLAGSTTLGGLDTGLSPTAGPGLAIGAILVLVAVAFKIGAVPAHSWMPDVAQGAPAPVAAFVTSIPKVGGFIFLARLVLAFPADGPDWRLLVALLATATMTLGNLAALWQTDVRRLLGWSAVSQTGYGLMAIVALEQSELAVPSLLFFLLAYVVGNLAAFGVVVELRGRTSLEAYAGIGRARPVLLGVLLLAFLSFIGVPPLAGFIAKLLLFAAAIEADYAWLAGVAAVNTVVSIVYYVRVVAPAYFDARPEHVPTLARIAAVPTVTMGVAIVVIGLLAEPLVDAFAHSGLLH